MSDSAPSNRPSIAPQSIASPATGETGDLWIFGYGSLMWRPGFAHAERVPALLHGAHRALCVYSVRHRGTADKPGLVLGLDHGGACRGIAFRVLAPQVAETRAYLTAREQLGYVYAEVMRAVTLADGRRVRALSYLCDRHHGQYARGLDRAAVLSHVLQGVGESGSCRDYVLNTLEALSTLGINDHALSWLGPALRAASRVPA